ncbi:MAG: diaminopimelate decarboxylase [Armatimonadota bacterium]|nr:diaminopimelate decarboxylase [Armatimonadota bacterium]MDR7421695.1 diaminopimelate decarboxylase [Armatimonadota bacterium]MDR7455196.1 diaminopimelate decarboxylase [Armatimonadota bacterium]MDR7456520.1 diaminopimelate decarboxylase [Armatimonadota bacterium]MDR7495833.1 diaminopimelate decarboxylase [Armatimonadota bacterium]
MQLPQRFGFDVDPSGNLLIGGAAAAGLAARFGTPLHVLDEARVRANCRAYVEALRRYAPGPSRALFASKALCIVATCQLAYDEGMGLDVVSIGEIYTALQARVPADALVFHGSNKTPEEIAYGLEVGVGRFVVDNEYELGLLDRFARERGRRADVLLRVTPGIEPHTHRAIQTGGVDSKFGFGLLGPDAERAVRLALDAPGLRLRGLHCHIGSQILDVEPFLLAARAVIAFAAEMRGAGFVMDELNLGGGLGIRYRPEHEPPAPAVFVHDLMETVRDSLARHRLPTPTVYLEPGRSIVGDAGVTLYTVGAIKAIPGVRTYVSVDGGMYENPRPALYDARYTAVVATRAAEPPSRRVALAGRCCESGDVLIWEADLPEVREGDLVAVFSTGAYTYSMASNYNRYPRPAVVCARDGSAQIVVERETTADLVRHDRPLVPSPAARAR